MIDTVTNAIRIVYDETSGRIRASYMVQPHNVTSIDVPEGCKIAAVDRLPTFLEKYYDAETKTFGLTQ